MKISIPLFLTIFLVGFFALSIECSREKSWVGTYTLEVNEENREVYNVLQNMGLNWPTITLNADGTYTMVKSAVESKGTYRIQKRKATLTMTEYNGEPLKSRSEKPRIIHFNEDYRGFLMEGYDRDRWVRKE
jgi:hypothetical protein